ncbi:MAG: uncharacterized protein PWQ09_1746 [Candidatus Cloacimonadota bacterium]|nr:uncharacterized protein [Candidatus Cloacimonadota bacterium]
MKIWFDITNTPHVHFQLAIYRELKKKGHSFIFSARDFSETIKLLEKNCPEDFKIIGKHHGKSYLKKILGLFYRFRNINSNIGEFDLSISNGSENAIWLSWLRRKKSIAFGDNDQARQWTYSRFTNFTFFPKAIPTKVLNKQGLGKKKLYQFDGYKEDIYLADFVPDKDFLKQLPFDNYIIVRPENVQANYIRNGSVKSIVPELLKALSIAGYNIVYLPRYQIDRSYAEELKNVYIPEDPIDGLNACYYATAVLTGAGTLAREAACMGVPAVSFYAGKELLAVDKQMIKDGWTFFSRDTSKILEFLKTAKRRDSGLERSKRVKKEVMEKLDEVIERLLGKKENS